MKKFRFVIVGSGWRSLFYVRIAKEMPEVFEVAALLCRSEEKAQKIASTIIQVGSVLQENKKQKDS